MTIDLVFHGSHPTLFWQTLHSSPTRVHSHSYLILLIVSCISETFYDVFEPTWSSNLTTILPANHSKPLKDPNLFILHTSTFHFLRITLLAYVIRSLVVKRSRISFQLRSIYFYLSHVSYIFIFDAQLYHKVQNLFTVI